jgi:serine phosphatase RsbU (regulator of sigma subunit)
MQLHINPHDEAPVYRQIQRQIATAIADRQIHPGEALQSQEDLAAQLAVSPAAVRKAYEELQSDGLCDGSRKGRYRVSTPELGSVEGSNAPLALSLLKKELLTQELRTARRVQHRLLPPSEVRGSSWSINGRSYPAGALAGDFYDVVPLDNGIVDVVIADVAGKGLAAGLIMAATKGLLPLAASQSSPSQALDELNQRLLPWLGNREFVALAYARFDPRNGTVSLANAGLPDPYLLRRTGAVETLCVQGDRLPLGIRQDVSYSTSDYSIDPEDRLLLVTDGIPEAVDTRGNPLGYEGFSCLLESSVDRAREATPGDSKEWLDRLLDQVSQRTGAILDDDWTAVLLEYHRPRRKNPCRS